MSRRCLSGTVAACAALALLAGCGTLASLLVGTNQPAGQNNDIVRDGAAVLGRVDPGFAFNITLTSNNGANVIINNQAVALLPIGLAVAGDQARDSATVATDPQDGRVFYSVASNLGPQTQARVSIKSVPATTPVGFDDFIHGFSVFIRATRNGTTSADVTTRGANPLFDINPACADVAVSISNVRMLNNGGAPFGNVTAEAPREYFPPTLLPNQRPMVAFLRAGGTGQASGGKFIHLAGTVANVVDSDQTRAAANGGNALGSGFPTAQVSGEFAAVTPAGYTFAVVPDGNPATGEFTWTIRQAAYDGTLDANSGLVYSDAAQPITNVGNSLLGSGDVFEIATAAIMVTTP